MYKYVASHKNIPQCINSVEEVINYKMYGKIIIIFCYASHMFRKLTYRVLLSVRGNTLFCMVNLCLESVYFLWNERKINKGNNLKFYRTMKREPVYWLCEGKLDLPAETSYW